MNKKRIRITDGGIAIPLGNNTFLMRGRLHSQGGIGIGNGGKNDIEVEDGEVVKFNKDNIQVLSDQPMLNGISPANALLAGGNFNKIFKAQQSINGDNHGTYAKDGTEENIPDIVKQQKQWLKNWYAVRLPLLGKEHLQQYVDKGLNTKYIGENEISDSDREFLKKMGAAAAYFPANRDISVSTKYHNNKKTPISRTFNIINENEGIIKSAYDKSTIPLHEYSHALSFGFENGNNYTQKNSPSLSDLREVFIKDFINNDETGIGSSEYYSRDAEKYARIQELRYINDLNPKKTNYKLRHLKKFKDRKSKSLIKELKLGGMNEQDIINALNTWASNTNNETDNIVYAKNGARIKYDRGGISWLIDKLFGGEDNKENTNKENKKDAPIDWDEIKIKQAYTESGFDSKAVSKAPAYGLYQITPQTLKEFNDKTGSTYKIEDLYNDKINTEIRDWYMNDLYNREWNTKNNPSDSVRATKTIMAYNMGPTNLVNRLNELKAKGYDIYQSLDWAQDDSIPVESREYNDFILRNINNSISRNKTAYETSKKKNSDKVEGIRKGFKNGGQINMKLKNKNKQDITDIVMNEILPSSTGKRKKFVLGGSELALIGNAGLNFLSGLGQGIAGSINASKLRKMYDGLKRQSTFIPVAREHINTKVDVEPQLNLTAQTEYNLRRNAEMNTSNSKVARSQARVAALDRIRQDNIIYSDKYNKETQLRNAEAELQTRYNLVDAENKLTDIREQNDFDMQKAIGKANASTMEAQTWGNAIASTLGNTATSLMDYATMKNDLLKSNNEKAWDQYDEFQWGIYTDGIDANGKPILKSKYTNRNHPLYNSKLYKNIRNHFGIS